jgi:hypothetical protein
MKVSCCTSLSAASIWPAVVKPHALSTRRNLLFRIRAAWAAVVTVTASSSHQWFRGERQQRHHLGDCVAERVHMAMRFHCLSHSPSTYARPSDEGPRLCSCLIWYTTSSLLYEFWSRASPCFGSQHQASQVAYSHNKNGLPPRD